MLATSRDLQFVHTSFREIVVRNLLFRLGGLVVRLPAPGVSLLSYLVRLGMFALVAFMSNELGVAVVGKVGKCCILERSDAQAIGRRVGNLEEDTTSCGRRSLVDFVPVEASETITRKARNVIFDEPRISGQDGLGLDNEQSTLLDKHRSVCAQGASVLDINRSVASGGAWLCK